MHLDHLPLFIGQGIDLLMELRPTGEQLRIPTTRPLLVALFRYGNLFRSPPFHLASFIEEQPTQPMSREGNHRFTILRNVPAGKGIDQGQIEIVRKAVGIMALPGLRKRIKNLIDEEN